MSNQSRKTIERNIKQDKVTKKFYVTFYYGKNAIGSSKRKTKVFNTLEESRIALKSHELALSKGDAVEPNRMTLNSAISKHLEMLSLKSEKSTLYGY